MVELVRAGNEIAAIKEYRQSTAPASSDSSKKRSFAIPLSIPYRVGDYSR